MLPAYAANCSPTVLAADEFCLVCSVFPDHAEMALSHFAITVLGDVTAVRNALNDETPMEKLLCDAVHETLLAPPGRQVLVVLTEEQLGADERQMIEPSLRAIAGERRVGITTFSAATHSGLRGAAAALVQARATGGGWVLVTDATHPLKRRERLSASKDTAVAVASAATAATSSGLGVDGHRHPSSRRGAVSRHVNVASAFRSLPSVWALIEMIDELTSYNTSGSYLFVVAAHLRATDHEGGLLFPRCEQFASLARVVVASPIGLSMRLSALVNSLEGKVAEGSLALHSKHDTASFWLTVIGLVGLHALSTRRSDAGAQGWSLPYTWILADLITSASFLLDMQVANPAWSIAEIGDAVVSQGYGHRFAMPIESKVFDSLVADFVGNPKGAGEAWKLLIDEILCESLNEARSPEAFRRFLAETLPVNDSSGGHFFALASRGLSGGTSYKRETVDDQEFQPIASESWRLLQAVSDCVASISPKVVNVGDGKDRLFYSSIASGHTSGTNSLAAPTDDEHLIDLVDNLMAELELHGPWTWRSTNFLDEPSQEAVPRRFSTGAKKALAAEFQAARWIVGTVLREIDRLSQWQATVLQSLSSTRSFLRATGRVSSAEIEAAAEEVCAALLQRRVPAAWGGGLLDFSGRELASWNREVVARCSFLSGLATGLVPSSIWLAGFCNPSDMLTAARRRGAHKLQLPVEEVMLDVRVSHSQGPPHQDPWSFERGTPNLGDVDADGVQHVCIHGLSLVGAAVASIGGGHLCERPFKEKQDWLRLLRLVPRPHRQEGWHYECPVYRRWRRGRAPLGFLWLPSLEEPSLWARRGIALICELRT
eukprot:TRINITY_DN67464_c0_g1_i1.p1 TRINITY_DN67464_c0_g1~~TRINITY_DN67464_c0_g1_i1.p1  ORF type:complete len:883 (+),score=117.95 TRINITY_DN67464_c0_g1_i1:162-2651(+)